MNSPVAQFLVVLLHFRHFSEACFVGFEPGNAPPYSGVGIGYVAGTDIHHTSRLKGVEVEVVENAVQRIGRLVVVMQRLLSVKTMFLGVEFDADVVVDALLPVAFAGLTAGYDCHTERGHQGDGLNGSGHLGKVVVVKCSECFFVF